MTSLHNPAELVARILALKEKYGNQLLILTHHYQRKEIIDLGDFRGDSFGLSQKAAQSEESRFIVFCGVHFMAESAAILARSQQTVQIPNLEAGCWMADMSEIHDVERAWEEITSVVGNGSVLPVASRLPHHPDNAFYFRGIVDASTSFCETCRLKGFQGTGELPDTSHPAHSAGNLQGVSQRQVVPRGTHRQ